MKYFNLFDLQAKSVIKLARELSTFYGHREIEPEHILLAILMTPKCAANDLLVNICRNTASIRIRLESKLTEKSESHMADIKPGFSRRSVLLLTQSFQEMSRKNSAYIATEHILLALCFERFGVIAKLFSEFEVSRNIIDFWITAKSQFDATREADREDESETTDVITLQQELETRVNVHPLVKLLDITAEMSVVTIVKKYLIETNCPELELIKPSGIVKAVLLSDFIKDLKPFEELNSKGLTIGNISELKQIDLFESMFIDDSMSANDTKAANGSETHNMTFLRLNLDCLVVEFILGCALSSSAHRESLVSPERLIVFFLEQSLEKRLK